VARVCLDGPHSSLGARRNDLSKSAMRISVFQMSGDVKTLGQRWTVA